MTHKKKTPIPHLYPSNPSTSRPILTFLICRAPFSFWMTPTKPLTRVYNRIKEGRSCVTSCHTTIFASGRLVVMEISFVSISPIFLTSRQVYYRIIRASLRSKKDRSNIDVHRGSSLFWNRREAQNTIMLYPAPCQLQAAWW